jgi:hypothetical protein
MMLCAMTSIACAPTKVADPPANHPASPQAAARELPVLTKLEAKAEQPPAPKENDAHQHHEGGHQ